MTCTESVEGIWNSMDVTVSCFGFVAVFEIFPFILHQKTRLAGVGIFFFYLLCACFFFRARGTFSSVSRHVRRSGNLCQATERQVPEPLKFLIPYETRWGTRERSFICSGTIMSRE